MECGIQVDPVWECKNPDNARAPGCRENRRMVSRTRRAGRLIIDHMRECEFAGGLLVPGMMGDQFCQADEGPQLVVLDSGGLICWRQ